MTDNKPNQQLPQPGQPLTVEYLKQLREELKAAGKWEPVGRGFLPQSALGQGRAVIAFAPRHEPRSTKPGG